MSEHRIPLTPIEQELKTSKAQLEAVKRYDAKLDQLHIKLLPELKRAITARADSQGKSVTKYILDLVTKDIVDSALSDTNTQ